MEGLESFRNQLAQAISTSASIQPKVEEAMLRFSRSALIIAAPFLAALLAYVTPAGAGITFNGIAVNGVSMNGITLNGIEMSGSALACFCMLLRGD